MSRTPADRMTSRASERRLRTRYKTRLPVVLRDNGHEITGFTRNVSLLGVSAYVNSFLSQVQPIQCVLNIPQRTEPLVATGTVIRCEQLTQPHPDGPYEVGVFFKDFEKEGESNLSLFLNQLLEEEHSAVMAGYQALKQRQADRQRRRRLKLLLQKRRRLLRLRLRKKRALALQRKKKLRSTRSKKSTVRRKSRTA